LGLALGIRSTYVGREKREISGPGDAPTSRDDGIRVQLCDGGIRSTLTKRDEGPAGGSAVTLAQPPPHLVRVVTQLVEREPAGGA
jgi:hypothetical protein